MRPVIVLDILFNQSLIVRNGSQSFDTHVPLIQNFSLLRTPKLTPFPVAYPLIKGKCYLFGPRLF